MQFNVCSCRTHTYQHTHAHRAKAAPGDGWSCCVTKSLKGNLNVAFSFVTFSGVDVVCSVALIQGCKQKACQEEGG